MSAARGATAWGSVSIVAASVACLTICVISFVGRTWISEWLGLAAAGLLILVGLLTGLVALWRSHASRLSITAMSVNVLMVFLLCLWSIWPTERSLFLAIRQGDISAARFALQTGVGVETLQLWGMGVRIPGHSPLTMAAENGDEEMMRLLLEWRADVNRANGHGDYPLYYAAWSGDLESAKLLLQKGAEPAAIGSERSALHIAAMMGHLKIIDLLLAAGVHLNLPDRNGATPLAAARISRNAAGIEYLLQKGARNEVRPNAE